MKLKYTAFIVDIVNSKMLSAEDRKEAQVFIKESLEILNLVFRVSLEFEVIFSAGDELQGLFKDPVSAFMYYRLLKMILAPLQIRCGMGVGELNVKMTMGTSAEQDGPAYYNAREAILTAHKISGTASIFHSDNENDIYVNTLFNCANLLLQEQSENQSRIYLLTECLNPLFNSDSMELSELRQICQAILNQRQVQYFSERGNLSQSTVQQIFDFEAVNVFSEALLKNKILLESTVKRGLSAKISNITNTSRQNIDDIIKSANIAAIRNIDLTTILFLRRNYSR